jgi:hypothetical protein
MTRWRRLCIDLDDYDCPIGGSVEYYSDSKLDPERITVLSRFEWNGRTPAELLEHLVDLGFAQQEFDWPPRS